MDPGTVVGSSWSGVPIDWDGGQTTSIHCAGTDEINVMPSVEFIPIKSGKGVGERGRINCSCRTSKILTVWSAPRAKELLQCEAACESR
jgi:hypothetical protein